MKKLFSFLLSTAIVLSLTAPTQHADAQIVKAETVKSTAGIVKTSLTGSADTAYALSGVLTASHKAVEMAGTKTSGTVGGKIYFKGKTLDGSWVALDSLTIANQTGLQYKLIAVPALIYSDFRFEYYSTGGTWAPAAYSLRRN